MAPSMAGNLRGAPHGVQRNFVTAVDDYISGLSDNTVPADNLPDVLQYRTGPANSAAKFGEPLDHRDRA
jgi:hypothetical protein